MAFAPELPLATGTISLDEIDDPLIVDPGPGLLDALVGALADAAPSLVDPGLDTLRAAARSDADPLDPPPEFTSVSLLAKRDVFTTITDGFHAASRVAALLEADILAAWILAEPQPNVVLTGTDSGTVLVETDEGHYAVGSDPTLRNRYSEILDAADPVRLPTPSRHRLYGAFHARCRREVADDVVTALETGPDPRSEVVDPRLRAYLVGARHGVLDHTLRRACEDAGLGSPSTFTAVKRRLVDAGLIRTERVSQPVGRPRKRLRLAGSLAEASISRTVRVARYELGE